MLEKYTHIRNELDSRESLLKRAVDYTITQETIIIELRGFIEDLLWGPNEDPMDIDRVAKRRYRKSMGTGGKPMFDRILHEDKNNFFKFGLYTSGIQDDAHIFEDDEDSKIYELKELV